MNENQARLALITGATGAIGQAIAVEIARQPGYRSLLVCRSLRKAETAVRNVVIGSGNREVSFELADLSSKTSIEDLARRINEPVHVLVNNAAATSRRRLETADGIELQFATNVLGYFWMIRSFMPHLEAGAPSRVVNVASYWAGDLALDDLEFRRRPYDNNTAYRQAKQANRMLTVAFAERLGPHGITVNACHPGDVNSALSNDLGFGGHESPQEGARTPAWLAVDPRGQQETGRYFEHQRLKLCRFGADEAAVCALYEACERY